MKKIIILTCLSFAVLLNVFFLSSENRIVSDAPMISIVQSAFAEGGSSSTTTYDCMDTYPNCGPSELQNTVYTDPHRYCVGSDCPWRFFITDQTIANTCTVTYTEPE